MLVFLLIFSLFANLMVQCTKYKNGQVVPMYVNKVGPYFNPHETYHYYELPVCRPSKIEHKALTLGEVLDGDRMAVSLYKVKFREDTKEILCKLRLSSDDIQKLRDSVEDLYYFEWVLDDIPLRGFIGHLEEGGFLPHSHKVYLWTHHNIVVEYNKEEIIYASVNTNNVAAVSLSDLDSAGEDVTFSYSVTWKPSTIKYSERGQRLRENSFFPKSLEIHWLSIINSLVLVLLLMGFVTVILTRILKKDFARYNLEDDESEDDNGWKIVHTDVFRPPAHKCFFAAILGTGAQFLSIITGILLMALLDLFNVHKHGSINTAAILLYALTSCVAGYVSANMFRRLGGEHWIRNVNITSALFALPFAVIWAVVNSVAWAYGTTQALPWTTILMLIALWVVLGYPLTILGAIFGKNSASSGMDAPCRTKNIPREIPRVSWFKSAFVQCLVGGFLPFSAVSVELYYIYATLWGRNHYALYGILCIIYVILLSVTSCVSVALTYFQLSAEDYHWWWRSIFNSGSTSLFVFAYSIFFYFFRSSMSGVIQTVEYFGYSILTCYVFFLSLGTVSFFASLKFVRYIYVNVKMD